MRTDALLQEFDLNLRLSVFPLHPETPQGGRDLADLFPGLDVGGMLLQLQGVAAEVALPFGARTRTYNSRRAQELGKWAEAQGRGKAFHDAVYHAYFVDGVNIARTEVLSALAEAAGLDGAEATKVVTEGRFAPAVDSDWERAGNLGISAVPSFLYQGRRLVGFQPYASFRKLITG